MKGRGYTISEVLVSIMIISVLIIGVSKTFTITHSINNKHQNENILLYNSISKLEGKELGTIKEGVQIIRESKYGMYKYTLEFYDKKIVFFDRN